MSTTPKIQSANGSRNSSLAKSRERILRTTRTLSAKQRNTHHFLSILRIENLEHLGTLVLAICILLIPLIGYLKTLPYSEFTWTIFVGESAESAPLLLSGGLVVFSATIYTDWRQKREASFKLMETLQSAEMMKVRHDVLKLMRDADGINDIESMVGWFPTLRWLDESEKRSLSEFQTEHALNKLAYLAYQINLYNKNKLIDKRTAELVFKFFFAHFEIVLVELSYALEKERENLNKERFCYDEEWNNFSKGVRNFFKDIGLSGELPETHEYFFFPSLNSE